MHKAEPSALRNQEAIQGTGIKVGGLGYRCMWSKCFSAVK